MATARRGGHYIGNANVEAALGIAAGLLAWALLRDAYDGRGRSTPVLLRPFTWW